MDYDYGPPSAPPVIAVDGLDPMPFRMTIYGPCSNPTVTIGGNQYRITGDIPGGARVEVDAVEASVRWRSSTRPATGSTGSRTRNAVPA